MKRIFLSFIILFISCKVIYPLDTNVFKYYPLQVGNVWVHYFSRPWYPPFEWNEKKIVTGTVILNSKFYFVINDSIFIRIDSSNGNLLQYTTSGGCSWLQNEILIDSLASRLHDSSNSNCQRIYACSDTTWNTIFGISRPAKVIRYFNFEQGDIRRYTKDFGMTSSSYGSTNWWTNVYLKGCIINGVLYGDTSMIVGTGNAGKVIPDKFSLSQNYPNPFNPNTKIKFDIPPDSRLRGNDNVALKIFDVLGHEIATLVNEQLQPGTYEAEWDGTNYPSGVYFYKLITNEFTETRKMVLVK